MLRRAHRLTLVALLGLLFGVALYVIGLAITNPGPRDAAGWELFANLPTARGETAAAVADGRLYVIGGLAGLTGEASPAVSVFDETLDVWDEGPALPSARHHAAAVGLDGTVYVSGGGPTANDWTPQSMLWSLPPGAEAWQRMAPMPDGRLAHRMLAVEGRLYVVGGIGTTRQVLIYDPGADGWATGAEIPVSRDHLAAVAIDDEIWAIGGRSGGEIHTRVDIYDTRTDTWRAGPPLPAPTSGASEAVVDGVILVSGGEGPGEGGRVIDRHWQLDTGLGSMAAWEPLSAPPLAVHGAHGAALEGRFFIVGGALRPGAFSRFSWTDATQAYELP